MKKSYQISINDVRKIANIYKCLDSKAVKSKYEQNKDEIKKHLFQIFANYKKEHVLDGAIISQLFFPTKLTTKFKVFISHSSDDKDEVRVLAKYLEANGINCFVDWMVWENLTDLQKIIDDKYCVLKQIKDENNKTKTTYNYDARNYTTAHTHAMLSMALLDMIDKCDIFLFVTSENSTLPSANFTDVKTLSPWIYEEISYINHIARRETGLFSEGATSIRISHPLDLSNFATLNQLNLVTTLMSLND